MDDMLYYAKAAAYISAAIAIGLGTLGPAWGQGTTGAKACESIGKNPESAPKVRKEQLKAEALQHTLVATEQEVVRQQQKVQETWLAMQQRLLQQRPSIESMPRVTVFCRQTDHSDELSQQACSHMYEQLAAVIIDRLSKLEKDS
ncbi:unnamed protein product [Sphagnum balticum]